MAYTSFPSFPPTPSPRLSPEPTAQTEAAQGHGAQEEPSPPQVAASSSAPGEASLDPAAAQAQQRRASERDSARLFGTAGTRRESPPAQQWDLKNATVIRQLEKILGTSLTPKDPAAKEVLRQALKREIEELGHYLKKIRKYQERAQQPDKKLSRLDGFFCPHVTAMENARHPGLELEHFSDMSGFIAHLQDSFRNGTPPVRRAFVRCGEDTLHHVVIDIVRTNGKLSLICMEPVPLHAPPVMSAINSLDRGLRRLEPQPYVWSYLSCNVQTSSNDCVPFGQSIARQMKDEPDFMDEMHERQIAGKPLRTSKSPDGEGALLEEAVASETHNVHQIISNAHTFMPLRFLKHTNSINTMETWMNERLQDKETSASKGSDSYSPQSLLKFVRDHVPRLGRWIRDETTFRETTHHYNTSIEGERKEAAEKTLELFRHIEKTLDESL